MRLWLIVRRRRCCRARVVPLLIGVCGILGCHGEEGRRSDQYCPRKEG